MEWRDNLDPTVKEHFNELLKKVQSEKKAYASAKNISHAQLWSAMAVLMREISHLELRIKILERQTKPKKKNSVLKKSIERL